MIAQSLGLDFCLPCQGSGSSSINMPGGRTLAELRQLVSSLSLTRDEARYLRLLLSDVRTDLIGELPVELVSMIALHLGMGDFARCLRVSKVWRGKFLSEAVLMPFAKHHWPAVVTNTTTASHAQMFLTKLGSAIHSYRWWSRFTSRHLPFVGWGRDADIDLDPDTHSNSNDVPLAYLKLVVNQSHPISPDAMYAFGKVAYHPCGYVVVVDDILSMLRKVFEVPGGMIHGPGLELQALGSRLVVGTVDRVLIAWDHVDNVSHKKLLPSRSLRCATQDNKVAVILYGGVVLIWTCGNAILELSTSTLKDELGICPPDINTWDACLNAYFDPRDSKTTFLVSGYTPSISGKDAVCLTVHEFTNGNHVASWVSNILDIKGSPYTGDWEREPRIVTREYECEQGYIFFVRVCEDLHDCPLAAFCKVKREFIYSDEKDGFPWSWNSMLYALPDIIYSFPHGRGKPEGGCDLDSRVQFGYTGYTVKRAFTCCLPY